jgi:hypothetical protein
LVGSRSGIASGTGRRFGRVGVVDSNCFSESVATPALDVVVGAAIENLIWAS